MTAAEAYAERDRVLSEVEIAHRQAITDGLGVIVRWAKRGEPFSANDCRDELRSAGVRPSATGGLFNAAIKARIIRRVGHETSTDLGTHAKPIARYIDAGIRAPLEVVTVPVQRDRGRFTASTPSPTTDGPTLFTFMEQS